MSYQQQEDDFLLQQEDQKSMNKAFDHKELKQYLNFKRAPLKIDDQIIAMKIDIATTVKYFMNDNGQQQPKPMIKIYAVNDFGNSIQIDVKNFAPYFYSQLPRNLPPNQPQQVLEEIRQKINKYFAQYQAQKRKKNDFRPPNRNAITRITYEDRRNIRNYVPDEYAMNKFWKIQTSVPNVINQLRRIFEEQTVVDGLQLPRHTFQSNIPYVLRFMIDKDITGMGWMGIKNYKIIRKETEQIQQQETLQFNKKSKKQTQKIISKCQLQIQCDASDIEAINDKMDMPGLRILSFDIECAAQQGFPDPQRHPIIQIACVCKTSTSRESDYKVVFCLNTCDKISGVHVMTSNDQKDLLLNFQKLMVTYDPDFITGYNMVNFDLWYIIERAKHIGLKNYGIFGRSKGVISRVRNGNLQSKIMGNRQFKEINIDGRIQLDMLIHMNKQFKFSSYKLNNVAYQILGDQKQDVHHTQIYKLFKGDNITRKRLAIYCIKDAQLPLRLFDKLCCLYNYSQMARVTGVPLNFLLNRGQQIKVMSQLLRKAKDHKYICPTERVRKNDGEIGYQGAYVLDPKVGYYDDPIATLDFASLYPSIMIAHNLCYTTLIRNDMIRHYNIPESQVTQTSQKVYFVKKSVRPGLLPEILKQLLAARKRAKTQLKTETDPFMRNVLQGRQLALKISANSVYGFTGALVGQLPCLEISSSVTWFGRKMIDNTRNAVLAQFPGSDVIYGDTDSVMVKFKLTDSLKTQGTLQQKRAAKIKQSMKWGQEAAATITHKLFDGMDPIKLQFQKVYCPYLLIAKKRYAGVYYSSSHTKFDKIDKKGIQSVRRDNCVMIRRILEEVLKLVLCESDKNGKLKAANFIKQQVSLLVQNKIDISQLVISKGISKKTGEEESDDDQNPKKTNKSKASINTYKVKQAHVELAQKMKKRDENLNIGIGDRISYVMINGQKGSKNYDNAQTPLLVLQEDLPIDYDYYINKQIRPPLQRLLGKTGIIDNFDSLFCGDHTKNRYIPKIGKSNFFSKFVEKKQTCLNCPTVTLTGDLCERCQPKRMQIYLKKQAQVCKMRRKYQKMWQQCINCQGANFEQVLCKNQDCPIFYRRMKIKKDLGIKNKQMLRFQW